MRIRTLKPEILTDEKSAGLTDTAWRLLVSLIVMADDYGRFRANPAFVHSQVFWASNTSREASGAALETLARLSLVTLYEVAGQRYGKITNWERHQRVDHPGKPLCPEPEEGITRSCADSSRESREELANIPETLAPDRDQDQDHEREKDRGRPAASRARKAETEAFTRFWAAYPKKTAKGQALKAWPGDALLEPILAALAWQVPTWSDIQYVKHPATWLRARCWEDERPATTPHPRPTAAAEQPFRWPTIALMPKAEI